ncbi:MAG: response regulator [Verrucomicrobia bacterium]|nr:response regulator [Verrucomicrobiota bacterium]
MKPPLRILYLEDDPTDAELVEETLAADGISCEIVRVETEGGFTSSLKEGGFDLILADYTLPSFDGLSALKIAQKEWPHVPLIFVSGTLGEELAIEALKIGATDYVLKNRLSRLVPSVQRALREAGERLNLSKAQEALQRSEAYLTQGQKLSRTGSFGWDFHGGKIYWSQETFRIFGYEPPTEPTLELLLRRTHPEDRGLVQEFVDRVWRERNDFDFQHRLMMSDGSVKYLRVVGHPSKNASGSFEFVGAVTDITEQKLAEEALRKAQAELAHITRVTTLGELTASIAHEINQPLAAVLTNANLGIRWLSGNSPNIDEASAAMRRIVRDGNRVSDVISRMRALFKKAPTANEWLAINDAIAEIVVLTQGEAQRNSVLLRTELADDLPLVSGDRIQLQQVVLNLLMNAIEAMSAAGEGPRELWISSTKVAGAVIPKKIIFDAKRHAESEYHYILVGIRDSGPGLDPENLGRVFDAFFTTKPQGLGMGLAISTSIIEAHGGQLWATPNEPRGAVFQFALPITG